MNIPKADEVINRKNIDRDTYGEPAEILEKQEILWVLNKILNRIENFKKHEIDLNKQEDKQEINDIVKTFHTWKKRTYKKKWCKFNKEYTRYKTYNIRLCGEPDMWSDEELLGHLECIELFCKKEITYIMS